MPISRILLMKACLLISAPIEFRLMKDAISLKFPWIKDISPKEVDERYHTQHEVEEIFKACKNELSLRPNHHQKDENIAGHIYLTFLAYFVQRYLELKLMKNQCNQKASTFLARFSDICVNSVSYNGHSDLVVTHLDKEQSNALKSLKINMPKGTVGDTLGKYLL